MEKVKEGVQFGIALFFDLAFAPEQLDLVGDHFRYIALVAIIGRLGSGLQFARNSNFLALYGILLDDFGGLAPSDDRMPVRGLYLFALVVLVVLIGCQRKTDYFFTAFKVRNGRFLTNVSNQLYMVFDSTHNKIFKDLSYDRQVNKCHPNALDSLRFYFFEVIYLLYLERFPFLFFLVPLPF